MQIKAFLLYKFVCMCSNEVLKSYNTKNFNTLESNEVESLENMCREKLHVNVVCSNNHTAKVHYPICKKLPYFMDNLKLKNLLAPNLNPLVELKFSAESFGLFVKIQTDEMSLNLLVEFLNFDKKNDILDIYILLFKLETNYSINLFLHRIVWDDSNSYKQLEIAKLKRYEYSEIEKTFKTGGALAKLIISKLCEDNIKPLADILNLKFRGEGLFCKRIILSYLDYKPLIFHIGDFYVYLEYEMIYSLGRGLSYPLVVAIILNTLSENECFQFEDRILDFLTLFFSWVSYSVTSYKFIVPSELKSFYLLSYLYSIVERDHYEESGICVVDTSYFINYGTNVRECNKILRIYFENKSVTYYDTIEVQLNFRRDRNMFFF